MSHPDLPGEVSPVLDGVFPDGPDTVLLNPAFTACQWRRKQTRDVISSPPVLKGLSGAGVALLAYATVRELTEQFVLGLGAVVLVLAGWWVVSRLSRDGRDLDCRLLETQLSDSEGFRVGDFTDLGAGTVALVNDLLSGVDELHRSPARPWIDPALPGEAYRVVWRALCCLDRSREVRALADELASNPDAGQDLAAAARQAADEIDRGLGEVAGHVHGCLLLTRAWEAKLRRTDLAARVGRALAALPGKDHVRDLSQAAEALPRNVFAYVTAARDLTQSGDFPWEQARSAWPRFTLLPTHGERTTRPTTGGSPENGRS